LDVGRLPAMCAAGPDVCAGGFAAAVADAADAPCGVRVGDQCLAVRGKPAARGVRKHGILLGSDGAAFVL
jgi:hypothetical protein